MSNNQPLPQTVLPVCKNNLYVAASDGFFADGSNKAVNFDSDVIFAATEQNPWDEEMRAIITRRVFFRAI